MIRLYKQQQIKSIDALTAQHLGLTSFELMQVAGKSIFSYVQFEKNILIITGAGNNAGDGFIIAQLALNNRIKVKVWSLVNELELPRDSQKAAAIFKKAGGEITYEKPQNNFDCIIDSIFGTGLNRLVQGVFADAIEWINQQKSKVVSVDIPSGIDTNTGSILGSAVKASQTITLICHKPGLYTNEGKEHCGNLYYAGLNTENMSLKDIKCETYLLDRSLLASKKFNRPQNSHKGSFGQVLIVGGHDGMLGALILSGQAALRSGCGVVEVVSNNEQAVLISLQQPELITANSIKTARFFNSTNVIAIGPGLGLSQQSKEALKHCLASRKTMVIDADALTIIANKYTFNGKVILTPHPKEAATLLNTSISQIQQDRVSSAIAISKKYHAVVILKGSGTIVASPNGDTYICPFGYSGMATAGMGDVLTGIVSSLLAQGFTITDAAITAVTWHAVAAENANKGLSLIASDVIEKLAQSLS